MEDSLRTNIQERMGSISIEFQYISNKDLRLSVLKDNWKTTCGFLRGEFNFNELVFLSAYNKKNEVAVVCCVYSKDWNRRVFIETSMSYSNSLDSVSNFWVSADWMEKEASEMYGIEFDGNKILEPFLLRKIGLEHPMKKDMVHEL